MDNFGIYLIITKPVLSYSEIARICIKNKIKMLQLREKHLPDKELLKIARELRNLTKNTSTKLVINDRPDIAVMCDADYLHIGQDDIDADDARKIIGNMKIGISTHSIEQAKAALLKKPDYIGFGPIYQTNAKAKPDNPVGTEQLREVLKFSNVPVVAIGGIFPENFNAVIKAGAKNIAMVRYFMQYPDLENRINVINKLLNYEHTTSGSN
jgi:thiamine-phosphate pyrophosphorylase